MLTNDTSINIERWQPTLHICSKFDCGVERLNNFLNFSAKKQQKADMARIYVAVTEDLPEILGYSAINVGSMSASDLLNLPKGVPGHGEIPILFLGQVAVDLQAQGKGIGTLLLHHVFEKAFVISREVGCHAVLLDVMSDGDPEAFTLRKRWYAQFGFQSFKSREARMFLTIKQIESTVMSTQSL